MCKFGAITLIYREEADTTGKLWLDSLHLLVASSLMSWPRRMKSKLFSIIQQCRLRLKLCQAAVPVKSPIKAEKAIEPENITTRPYQVETENGERFVNNRQVQ